jgi:hypothetical protein
MTIRVTFKEHFPLQMVKELCESEFMGLCNRCKASKNPRVLHLSPTSREYRVLKSQLEELQREGALSFAEQREE